MCRVGAGVGVGDEDEEAGRESRRRREERAGRRGAGVTEGFCAGAGERGGKEELLGEGRVDIFEGGCWVGLGGILRRRGLDGCDDMVGVGSRRGEGGVEGWVWSVSVGASSLLCMVAGCGAPLAVCSWCFAWLWLRGITKRIEDDVNGGDGQRERTTEHRVSLARNVHCQFQRLIST